MIAFVSILSWHVILIEYYLVGMLNAEALLYLLKGIFTELLSGDRYLEQACI